ncbi:unnamed protein product, partial [Oppiella nova]
MGYSLLAQVKPVFCLYSSFFPILIYSLMGTSRHCSVGTFAALAIMTGAIINQVRESESTHPMQSGVPVHLRNTTTTPHEHHYSNAEIAIVCSFIVGCYQLIFGFLRLGFVSVYMSEQFLNGFTCAVAYHVVGSQFQHMFGIDTKSRSGVFSLSRECIDVIANISHTNIVALMLSVVCTLILLAFKCYLNDVIKDKFKIKVPFPIEIFVVIGSVIASNLLDLEHKHKIKVVGHIERGLPSPVAPWDYWPLVQKVWVSCVGVSVVSYA